MVIKSCPQVYGMGVRVVDSSMPTNRELIDGFLMGDPSAANAFHERYSARIARWVWRLLGPDTEHEDFVQQVFVNIFKKLSSVRDGQRLDSWIDSVTIKTVRYELRKRRIRRAFFVHMEGGAPQETKDMKSPFRDHHARVFYKILDRLAADDRIVFTLRFLEGCSIDHIAAAGNYSRSTAKRRLNRAKAVFAQIAIEDFSLVSLAEEFNAV